MGLNPPQPTSGACPLLQELPPWTPRVRPLATLLLPMDRPQNMTPTLTDTGTETGGIGTGDNHPQIRTKHLVITSNQ